jgi:dihydrofolate reductase
MRDKTMPRKIVVTEYVSLDGVVEDPVGMEGSGLGNWTGPFSRGSEGDKFKVDEIFSAESMIYGRRTYEAFAAAWPNVEDQAGYADRMNSLPKYVASSSITEPTWTNTKVWCGNLVETVNSFKAGGDGDVLLFGSVSIVHQLAPYGVIDEWRLMVYPVVLGRGKPLFPPGVQISLAIAECRQFGGGIVLLRYVVA